MLSSTLESPSMTDPSTGMRSPARTITSSPASSSATSTSTTSPARTTRAVFGCSLINASIAAEVLPFARASSTLPSMTSVITAALASK